MAHESNATTLRSGAEESNLGLLRTQSIGIMHHAVPGGLATGIPVVLQSGEVDAESSISLDDTPEADLQQRDQRGTKVTASLA